ncbi:MAG TPA: NAD(P)H-dependent oxidoreductase subunit E [Ornithinibacter sp.]|nr:NAD(P)H-dependent oxidoreductase subunit E [Ornithinibacter sp.]
MTAAPESETRADSVRRLAERQLGRRGPLLPILHDVVAAHGFVDGEDVRVLADVLNLSRADVHGVVSFYADFRRTPPPEHRVTVCRGEACQSLGAEAVHAAARAAAATVARASVEVDEVFCLGNCVLGPSGTVDGRPRGRLTPESVTGIVAGLA